MREEGGSRVTSKLKQGAHIQQPTAWPLPHACAQPHHAGSGSHGRLLRPYWGSSVWHSRRSVTGENPCCFCLGAHGDGPSSVMVSAMAERQYDI